MYNIDDDDSILDEESREYVYVIPSHHNEVSMRLQLTIF